MYPPVHVTGYLRIPNAGFGSLIYVSSSKASKIFFYSTQNEKKDLINIPFSWFSNVTNTYFGLQHEWKEYFSERYAVEHCQLKRKKSNF